MELSLHDERRAIRTGVTGPWGVGQGRHVADARPVDRQQAAELAGLSGIVDPVARKNLIAADIPQEKTFIDEDRRKIKVIIPEELSPQVREVFGIHKLTQAQ